jgi:hypothetical protein
MYFICSIYCLVVVVEKEKKNMLYDIFGNLKNRGLDLSGIMNKMNFNGFIQPSHNVGGYSKAMRNRINKRRARNKMARKSRRINRLRMKGLN